MFKGTFDGNPRICCVWRVPAVHSGVDVFQKVRTLGSAPHDAKHIPSSPGQGRGPLTRSWAHGLPWPGHASCSASQSHRHLCRHHTRSPAALESNPGSGPGSCPPAHLLPGQEEHMAWSSCPPPAQKHQPAESSLCDPGPLVTPIPSSPK